MKLEIDFAEGGTPTIVFTNAKNEKTVVRFGLYTEVRIETPQSVSLEGAVPLTQRLKTALDGAERRFAERSTTEAVTAPFDPLTELDAGCVDAVLNDNDRAALGNIGPWNRMPPNNGFWEDAYREMAKGRPLPFEARTILLGWARLLKEARAKEAPAPAQDPVPPLPAEFDIEHARVFVDPTTKPHTRAHALAYAFMWSDTPQGRDFWQIASDRVREERVSPAAVAVVRAWIAAAEAQQAQPEAPAVPEAPAYLTPPFDPVTGLNIDAVFSALFDGGPGAVAGIGSWSDTPQGFRYWSEVCEDLKAGQSLPNEARTILEGWLQTMQGAGLAVTETRAESVLASVPAPLPHLAQVLAQVAMPVRVDVVDILDEGLGHEEDLAREDPDGFSETSKEAYAAAHAFIDRLREVARMGEESAAPATAPAAQAEGLADVRVGDRWAVYSARNIGGASINIEAFTIAYVDETQVETRRHSVLRSIESRADFLASAKKYVRVSREPAESPE